MPQKGRILAVDDLPRWRAMLVGMFESAGFYARATESIASARVLLRDDFFHLLILDINMDKDNPTNSEGFQFLRDLGPDMRRDHDPASAVIVLSSFGTTTQMREAFRDYDVVDFVDKKDYEDDGFRDLVAQLFAKDMQINLDLSIAWANASSAQQAVANIELNAPQGKERIRPDTPLQARAAAELEDLLCRLFHTSTSIIVKPLARGRSGAGVLRVQQFDAGGQGPTVVVKYGDAGDIAKESSNYESYVQRYLGSTYSTVKLNTRSVSLLGGIAYSFMGSSQSSFQSFGEYYQRHSAQEITAVLDRLFLQTCKGWYGSISRLEPMDLSEHYIGLFNLNQERLEKTLYERMNKGVQGRDQLIFLSLNKPATYPNPFRVAFGQNHIKPTYRCVTHGDLNEGNLMVDDEGHVWLIDFLRTGSGHILRDVAQLDAAIRFQLIAEAEADLSERLAMEQALASTQRFSDVRRLPDIFASANPHVAKAYAVVSHLRQLAATNFVKQNPNDDFEEYDIASMYCGLATMRIYALPAVQKEHALLSASLLARKLMTSD